MTSRLRFHTQTLAALEARLAQDLEYLGWPGRSVDARSRHMDGEPCSTWRHRRRSGRPGRIGGAGAAGHPGRGVRPCPEGFEGPWATTARMETLRSPKELTGPALGLPSLTFRAWFEAQFGAEAWTAMDKIPRLQWMDYLAGTAA
jgi:hypothetical protein